VASRPAHPVKNGPLGKLVVLVLAFGFWLVAGAFGNIVVEWLGQKFLWPQEGVRHSLATLETELRLLDEVQGGLLLERPTHWARRAAADVHRAVYARAGADRWQAGPRGPGEADLARSVLADAQDYLLAAVVATQVYVLRLGVLVAALPLFGIAGLLGIVDGLGQRDLRRYGGGRERGQVYHLARGLVVPLFTAPWVLYLSWPAPIRAPVVVLPFAALFGAAVWVLASSFKKYL
jgi:integrating conjugative element membrane protein (TIGR03747 family)